MSETLSPRHSLTIPTKKLSRSGVARSIINLSKAFVKTACKSALWRSYQLQQHANTIVQRLRWFRNIERIGKLLTHPSLDPSAVKSASIYTSSPQVTANIPRVQCQTNKTRKLKMHFSSKVCRGRLSSTIGQDGQSTNLIC